MFALFLLSTLTACRTEIVTLPVSDEAAPLYVLDDGNWAVSRGYVIYHVSLMARVAILEAQIKELQEILKKK